jgi:hypothetical protein
MADASNPLSRWAPITVRFTAAPTPVPAASMRMPPSSVTSDC